MSNTAPRRGVRHEYAALAGRYDRRWAAYIAATGQATLGPLALDPGTRLLDVGCGTGVMLERALARWPGVRAAGVDLSPEMLVRARERLGRRVWLARGDAGALPFAPGSFDVAVSNSSLHFWPDPERGLREIARVLRPGGRLVVTDWAADFATIRGFGLWLRLTGRRGQRPLRAAQLADLMAAAGFGVADVRRWKLNWFWGLMTMHAMRTPD